MTGWASAAELADMQLPGLPSTKRRITEKAKREQWRKRVRTGKGGGWEYDLASLPAESRRALAAKKVSEARKVKDDAAVGIARRQTIITEIQGRAAARIAEGGLKRLAHLDGRDKERADSRLSVLEALDDYTRISNLSKTASITAFCAAYNDGDIEVDENVRDLIPTLHPQSIYRWRRAAKTEGAASLAGNYGNRKGSSLVDSQERLQRFCIAILTDHPHAGGKHLLRAVRARFSEDSEIKIPSERALQRWITNFRNENRELMTAIANPDAWKNKYMTAYGDASANATRLNAIWESDATPADVELTDGRHHIMGVIDVYSRRLQLLVTKTSTAQAVATSLRRAIIAWGVPERLKTDNGSDYTSKHVRRVLDNLGIEHILANPFSGWEKPHIERAFRTFSHGIAELLPEFIGHNVAQRQAIEARQSFADRLLKKNAVVKVNMTAADFQAFCDRWVEDIYHQEEHGGIGVSPAIKAAGQPSRRISDVRALDLLLQDGGVATVRKDGIHRDGFVFFATELDCVGERVQLLKDPDALGRVHVFKDGEFICIAEDPRFTDLNPREVAIEARKRQRERIQEKRRELKQIARKERTREVAEEILAERARARDASNVHALPGRTEEYESDHLAAASEAADAREGKTTESQPSIVTPEMLANLQKIMREEQREDETAEDRFRRWIKLDQALAAGEELNDIDRKFKENFEQGPEFKGRYLVYEDWGPSAFGL